MEFTHIANPVRVTAIRIEEVTDITNREPGCGQSAPDLMLRLSDGNNYRAGMDMTARYTPVAGDYLVRQEDGYEYLNPKDVFEHKYRVIGAETDPSLMEGYSGDFGYALSMLKAGHRVMRAGWNGSGQWVALGKGAPALPAASFWNQHTRQFAEDNGGTAAVRDYFILKTAQNDILMGWSPSQSDALADDWQVV